MKGVIVIGRDNDIKMQPYRSFSDISRYVGGMPEMYQNVELEGYPKKGYSIGLWCNDNFLAECSPSDFNSLATSFTLNAEQNGVEPIYGNVCVLFDHMTSDGAEAVGLDIDEGIAIHSWLKEVYEANKDFLQILTNQFSKEMPEPVIEVISGEMADKFFEEEQDDIER